MTPKKQNDISPTSDPALASASGSGKFKMITQGLDRQYHANMGELSKKKNTISYGVWKKRGVTQFVWGVWSKELGDEAKSLNQKQAELDKLHDAFEEKLEASKAPLFQNND